MIQEAVDVIADGIDARLRDVLAAMPGSASASLLRGGTVTVSRTTLTEEDIAAIPLGVRVEQQGEVTLTLPMEAMDEVPVVPVGVSCWISRTGTRPLASVSDDEMVKAVRALVRAVEVTIRQTFAQAVVVERDGVQVRRPLSVTFNEPEQGEDAALTVGTLSLSVPVLDTWALSAGGA